LVNPCRLDPASCASPLRGRKLLIDT
jgi:hypothetical protein